jgi:hypothetical protein
MRGCLPCRTLQSRRRRRMLRIVGPDEPDGCQVKIQSVIG